MKDNLMFRVKREGGEGDQDEKHRTTGREKDVEEALEELVEDWEGQNRQIGCQCAQDGRD